MTPDLRRHACPTIARPMETGDGLLARLPPSGPLPAATLRAIAGAARRFGNGIVEVTARGSLQVRGLSHETLPSFAAALADAGIEDTRPAIHVAPLNGCGAGPDAGLSSLGDALRAAIAEAGLGARLAPKASVVLDGPGALHLDDLDADLRLLVAVDGVAIAVSGTAATSRAVGRIPSAHAVRAMIAILDRLAAIGPTARGRDLDAKAVAAAIGAVAGGAAAPRAPAEAVGTHGLGAGRAAIGVALPFGHVDATTLEALVERATRAGATRFEPTVGRVLLAIDVRTDAAADFRRGAAALGFIVDPADRRRAVAACAGAPACGSARMAARDVADAVARAAAPILDGTATLHVSGCRKGCANPRAATLALVGTDDGLALAVNGRAPDALATGHATGDLVATVARLSAVIAGDRKPGETAAATITRLGAAGLAAALRPETIDA